MAVSFDPGHGIIQHVFRVLGFIFLLLQLTQVACFRSRPEPSKTVPTKWLRWAVAHEPQSLDWNSCSDESCRKFASLVMEGLTRIDLSSGQPRVQPALAESLVYRSSTVLIIKIKKQVHWSDGDTLEANHFLIAWRKLLSGCKKNPFAEILFSIKNARAFCEKRVPFSDVGIAVTDPNTLKLTLQSPKPDFLLALSDPSTWPIRSEKIKPGSVPATLGSFLPDRSRLRYERNLTYYNGPVPLAGVELISVPSGEGRVSRFQDKEADLVDELPVALIRELETLPTALQFEPTPSLVALVMNPTRRPFHLLQVREAFARSVDKEELLQLTQWKHIPVNRLLAFPNGTSPSTGSAVFSMSRALDLLHQVKFDSSNLRVAEGGQLRSFPRPTLAALETTSSDEILENLQAQWIKNLRIKVDLVSPLTPQKPRKRSVVTTALRAPATSLMLVTIDSDPLHLTRTLQPYNGLPPEFHARFKNKPIESLFEEAAMAADFAAYFRSLTEIEDILLERDWLVLPLFYRVKPILRRPSIKGLKGTATGWDFRSVTFD